VVIPKKKKKPLVASLQNDNMWLRIEGKIGRKNGLISHVRRTWVGFCPIFQKNLTGGLNCNFLKLQGGKLPILKLWGSN
jgi:hypothetical protein